MKLRFALALVATVFVPSMALASTNYFLAGFETNNTPSYQNGAQIHHAGGVPYVWNWSGSDIPVVTNAPIAVETGSQGLWAVRATEANSHYLWTRPTNAFAPFTSGVVSLSFDIKAGAGWTSNQASFVEIAAVSDGLDEFAANNKRYSWLTLKGDGHFYAFNGGTEKQFGIIQLTNWHHIEMDISLVSNTYNVFFDGTELGTNFAFYGSGFTGITSLQFKDYNNGLSTGGYFLDNVLVMAVPEPGALTVLLGGLGVLLALRRRPRS